MPHYYFHLTSPDGRSHDEIGSEFPDIESAYLGACEAALDMSVEMLRDRHDPSQLRFEISNGDSELLFDLPFSEVLRPSGRRDAPDKLLPSLQDQALDHEDVSGAPRALQSRQAAVSQVASHSTSGSTPR